MNSVAFTTIFFAGRLDHRDELIQALDARPENDDSALVLLAYRKHGCDCPKFLFGEFAFAIWDSAQQKVFAARDHAGCQPVYYHANAERFAIAESIEELLKVGGISRDLDDPFVASALTQIYTHPERTYLAEVRKVPPAHWLLLGPRSRTQQIYWRPEEIARTRWRDSNECAEAFRGVVRQAVRDRIPPQGRVGVHISGGLDCSTVAVLAGDELRQAGRSGPIGFTWQPRPSDWPDEEAKQEYEPIEALLAQEQIEQVYCPLTKSDWLEVLRRDETVRRICGSSYSEWPVQREAEARGVKVMMPGFGGDEAASFNGRGYYNGLAIRGRWGRLYREAKAAGRSPWRMWAGAMNRGLQHLLFPERLLGRLWREERMGVPLWKILLRAMASADVTPFLLSQKQREEVAVLQPYLNENFRRTVKSLPLWDTIRETSACRAQCDFLQQGHLTYRMESWRPTAPAEAFATPTRCWIVACWSLP